jgi:hypothetical protein
MAAQASAAFVKNFNMRLGVVFETRQPSGYPLPLFFFCEEGFATPAAPQ